jgi:hypothetical protein
MLLRSTFAVLFVIGFTIYCAYLIEAKRAQHHRHSWDIQDRNR